MSVDVLRRAAALMRERAEAATSGPWEWDPGDPIVGGNGTVFTTAKPVVGRTIARPDGDDSRPRDHYQPRGDMHYIASWHPAVALAFADILDHQAQKFGDGGMYTSSDHLAVVAARTYLGEPA